MCEQKTSLLERLKICWNVLTLKNYVYLGIGKNPIKWNDDGSYKELNKNSIRCLCYVPYDYKFMLGGKETNLHDYTWNCIESFAKEAQDAKC